MDERRLILAAVLSLAVVAAWQFAFPPPVPVEDPAALVETAGVAEGAPETAAPQSVASATNAPEAWALSAPRAAQVAEEVVVEATGYTARLSNRGASLVSLALTDHRDESGLAVDLVRTRSGQAYPYSLVNERGEALLADALFEVERQGPAEVVMRYADDTTDVEKRFSFGERGEVRAQIRARFADNRKWWVLFGPGVRNASSAEEGQQYLVREAVWRQGGEVERRDVRKSDGREVVTGTALDWVALDDTYFIAALFGSETVAEAAFFPAIRRDEGGVESYEPVFDSESVARKDRKAPRDFFLTVAPRGAELDLAGYWGAKQRGRLAEIGRGLPEAIDWGFFGLLSRPLHMGLLWIHERVVANYGWAIVLMTIALKIVLLPLTHAAHVSMQKMQEVNPKAQAVRAKYRSKLRDKQGKLDFDAQRRMNEEMQAVYKDAGVNPFGGCLPALAQIPIFFAYFRLLPLAVELRQAPWIGWIHDLSAADPYYLLPIIMGATQVVQMRLTPQAPDPLQRRIMQLFPVIFTVFSLGFPSGLVVYWLTNNVFTIGQIWVYNRWRARTAAATA